MAGQTGAAADRRPAILVAGWDADDDVWSLVEDLSGEPWHPAGARTLQAAPDAEGSGDLTALLNQDGTRALLLVGRSRHADSFEVQVRASLPATVARPAGDVRPSVARATAPVSDILRAIADQGLRAAIASEDEPDTGSMLLFDLLSDFRDAAEPPAIGLLRAPAQETEANVRKALKAAVQAIANHLTPLPRRLAV